MSTVIKKASLRAARFYFYSNFYKNNYNLRAEFKKFFTKAL